MWSKERFSIMRTTMCLRLSSPGGIPLLQLRPAFNGIVYLPGLPFHAWLAHIRRNESRGDFPSPGNVFLRAQIKGQRGGTLLFLLKVISRRDFVLFNIRETLVSVPAL